MKDAVCTVCQKKIQRIEYPLLARFYGGLRGRLGYRSREDKISKQKFPLTVSYPNGATEDVHVKAKEFPKLALVPSYRSPPFITANADELDCQGHLSILYDKEELLGFIQKQRPFANGVTTPSVRPIFIDALFLKMAIGLFFDTHPQSLVSSEISADLLSIVEPNADIQAIATKISRQYGPFSMPEEQVDSTRAAPSKAKCFEICEFGERYWYAELRFFPDIFQHRYFVRIPSLSNGAHLTVEYGRERKLTLADCECDALHKSASRA